MPFKRPVSFKKKDRFLVIILMDDKRYLGVKVMDVKMIVLFCQEFVLASQVFSKAC